MTRFCRYLVSLRVLSWLRLHTSITSLDALLSLVVCFLWEPGVAEDLLVLLVLSIVY